MNTSKQLVLTSQQTSQFSKNLFLDDEIDTSERRRIFNNKKTLDFGSIILNHPAGSPEQKPKDVVKEVVLQMPDQVKRKKQKSVALPKTMVQDTLRGSRSGLIGGNVYIPGARKSRRRRAKKSNLRDGSRSPATETNFYLNGQHLSKSLINVPIETKVVPIESEKVLISNNVASSVA